MAPEIPLARKGVIGPSLRRAPLTRNVRFAPRQGAARAMLALAAGLIGLRAPLAAPAKKQKHRSRRSDIAGNREHAGTEGPTEGPSHESVSAARNRKVHDAEGDERHDRERADTGHRIGHGFLVGRGHVTEDSKRRGAPRHKQRNLTCGCPFRRHRSGPPLGVLPCKRRRHHGSSVLCLPTRFGVSTVLQPGGAGPLNSAGRKRSQCRALSG